jgi:phenylalanyl-tRNA synthetase beta chain
MGALHPDVAARFELKDEIVVAEIVLEGLLGPAPAVRFASLPRFPAVSRDLSLLADRAVAAGSLEAAIRSAAGPLLQSVAFLDRYDRPPVPAGKTSLTVNLLFQDPARTLTGDEVEAALARVVEARPSAGVDIRGGV